jgi:hypothetical protein
MAAPEAIVLSESMRFVQWLPLLLLGACASSAPSAGSPGAAASVTVVTPVVRSAKPPAAASAENHDGCFATPVRFAGRGAAKLAARAVDPALPSRLAGCESDSNADECRYAVARTYFDANRFEAAAPIFRDLALSASKSELGIVTGHLYFDCMTILTTWPEPERPACLDELAATVVALEEVYCIHPAKSAAELCGILVQIRTDMQRLMVEKIMIQADRGSPDAVSLYRQGGDAYMELFDRRCAFRPSSAGGKPEPPPGWTADNHCDEVAYNAMKAYRAAREPALADRAQGALLDPVNRLDKTELAKKAAGIK